MTDAVTIEGSKERAAERGEPDFGLVEAARTAGDSLGNPAVVERLVQGFCHRVVEMLAWRRDGTIDAVELVTKVRAECASLGAIFMGADPEFVAVAGWNTERGLGNAVKVSIGGDRVRMAGGAGPALFEWLAEQLMAAFLSMDGGDQDAVGRRAQASITSVIDTLLGASGE